MGTKNAKENIRRKKRIKNGKKMDGTHTPNKDRMTRDVLDSTK